MLVGLLCAAIGRRAALGESCGFNGVGSWRAACRFGCHAPRVSRLLARDFSVLPPGCAAYKYGASPPGASQSRFLFFPALVIFSRLRLVSALLDSLFVLDDEAGKGGGGGGTLYE